MKSAFLRNALVLGMLSAVGPFAIDMYLPAFPAIAREFQVDVSAVQMSLMSFFLAVAVCQIVYGPLVRPIRPQAAALFRPGRCSSLAQHRLQLRTRMSKP